MANSDEKDADTKRPAKSGQAAKKKKAAKKAKKSKVFTKPIRAGGGGFRGARAAPSGRAPREK